MSIQFELLTLASFISLVTSARILGVFPVPFVSHQSVFRVLVEELARNGHELVVLTPLPHEKPIENVTEIDLHDISHKLWDQGWSDFLKHHNSVTVGPIEFWMEVIPRTMYKIVDAQYSEPKVKALIDDEKQEFDLILCESVVPLSIAVAARFKAPIIFVSSFFGGEENFIRVGATVHPLMFPDHNMQKIWNLSLWDKLKLLYVDFRLRYHEIKLSEMENSVIRKHFGENAPAISELRKNVHMMFVNVHHIWDNNRPVPPSVVYMGALHLKKPKPIPNDLQTYLNSSTNGVVYMSLGSKILFSDLPANTIKVFLDVFASLPYNVLLKWNGGEMTDKPANVKLLKWIPQNDLLHHPNIKVFITHGGLQSTDEAIAARVPVIGMPIFADQWYNSQKYIQHGIGEELDVNSVNENDLRRTIISVAEEQRYRDKIARLSRIMEEQRAGGLQKAVYWTEYVAKYGALHLRSPLADASLVDYFMLDVLSVIIIVSLIILLILIVLIKNFVLVYFKITLRNSNKLKSS